MSHYNVGVLLDINEIGNGSLDFSESMIEDKLNHVLNKYDENISIDEIGEYLDFNDETDRLLEYMKENKVDSFEEAAKEYGLAVKDFDGEKRAGFITNRISKYDYFLIGGRWNNTLKLKDGTTTNFALLKDIDFEKNINKANYAERFWNLYIEKDPDELTEEEKEMLKFTFYSREYFVEKYKTKENYIDCYSTFSTYAIVDTDGEWYEPGEMGWFGMSSASGDDEIEFKKNYYDKFIKNKDFENILFVMVDCHI